MTGICVATETRVIVNPARNIMIDALRNNVFLFRSLIRGARLSSLIMLVAHTVQIMNEQKTADNKTQINPIIVRIADTIFRTLIKRTIARSIESTTLYSVKRVEAFESRTPS